MLTRRGASLAELLVALAVGAIILAVATGTLLRQQQAVTTISVESRAAEQLRVATRILGAEAALHATGDLVTGALRDTAMQLRAAIASGLACDHATEPAIPTGSDGFAASAIASPPRVGDSLWAYHPDSQAWSGHAIVGFRTASAACLVREDGPAIAPVPVLRFQLADTDTVAAGSPVRVTRQERLVIYRSGDGTWQLGVRDWSAVLGAMASPQPAAGPFQRASPDGARTGFRYFDAEGREWFPEREAIVEGSIARVRLTVVASAGWAGRPRVWRESLDVALQRDGTP